jgi:hypothetical protein
MGVRESELGTARGPSDEPAATGLRGGACGGDSCVVGVYVCAALPAVTGLFSSNGGQYINCRLTAR